MSASDELITFAQNREDLYLYALLGDVDTGFYVDVGANDPVNDSVTKFFYLRGWRGINVEPNQELHRALDADRPRDVNLNVGVSDFDGTMKFRQYSTHSGLSTFTESIMVLHESEHLGYVDHEVAVTTLRGILTTHGVTSIDFMKIDVEGHELQVIAGNDWERFRPKVLVIEGGAIDEWGPHVLRAKYGLEFFDGLNYYYVADEQRPDVSIMHYASRVLSKGTRTGREVIEREAAERDIASLRRQLAVHAEPCRDRSAALCSRLARLWTRVAGRTTPH